MIHGRCPICSKPFQVDRIDDLPSFPFCSDRCRLVDLGRWIDESYSFPVVPGTSEDEDSEGAQTTSPPSEELDD